MTRSLAGRRALSTAGPLHSLHLPCGRLPAPVWPFPFGDIARHPSGLSMPASRENRGAKKEEQTMQITEQQDIYTRITGQIIASLERGV
jgi:hypothetical protein